MEEDQETNYNILKNEKGELMFLLRARQGSVEEPYIKYDKGDDTAYLYRAPKEMVTLTCVHPAIRNDLAKKKSVLVVETLDGSVVREYTCAIKGRKKNEKHKN